MIQLNVLLIKKEDRTHCQWRERRVADGMKGWIFSDLSKCPHVRARTHVRT